MTDDYIYACAAVSGLPPIRCWECNAVPMRDAYREEGGELHLRRKGWQGFSRLKDVRLGHCPGCQKENP